MAPRPILRIAFVTLLLPKLWADGETTVVNPANQQAVRILEGRIQQELTSRIPLFWGRSCHRCLVGIFRDSATAMISEMDVPRNHRTPPTVRCSALPDAAISCQLTGGSMQVAQMPVEIDGRWRVRRDRGVVATLGEGRFTLTVRDFNQAWEGTFTTGYDAPSPRRPNGATWYSARMPCDRDRPVPADARFTFRLNWTSGMAPRALDPVIERLARESVAEFFCQPRNDPSRDYLTELGTSLRQQMTWQDMGVTNSEEDRNNNIIYP